MIKTLTIIFLVLSIANGYDILDQQNVVQNQAYYYMNVSTRQIVQSFTTGSGVVTVSKITLWLRKYGSPTGNCSLYVYLADGAEKPTGSILGRTWLAYSSFPDSAEGSFTFATPVTVTGATKYCMVLNPNSGVSGSNYWSVFTLGTNTYSGGNEGYSTNSGGTWSILAADIYFKTYYYSGTPPKSSKKINPDILINRIGY
jgi:hypothetical protein